MATTRWSPPANGKTMVTTANKTLKQTKIMDQALTAGDEGPFDFIENNFSQFQAALTTSRDTYKLQFLFPTLGRSLKRKLGESGAVGDVLASPSKRLAVAVEACGDVGGTGHLSTSPPAPAAVESEAEATKEQLRHDDGKDAGTGLAPHHCLTRRRSSL